MPKFLTDPSGRRVRVRNLEMPKMSAGTSSDIYRSVGMTQKGLEREVRRELKHGRLTAEGATRMMEKSKDWPVK